MAKSCLVVDEWDEGGNCSGGGEIGSKRVGAADHEERRADPCGRTRWDAQLCAGGQGEESGSEGLGVIEEKVRTTNVLRRMGMREMGREATVS